MLKYKQIWHGIKPIRWLIKFNLTERNPAEYSPFAETNMSFGFSTDREVPLSVSKVLEEDRGRVCNRHRKRKKNEVSIRNARGIARSRSIYLLNVIHSYRIYI